jgi:hypothetical protein
MQLGKILVGCLRNRNAEGFRRGPASLCLIKNEDEPGISQATADLYRRH